jgi:hypothetical protein
VRLLESGSLRLRESIFSPAENCEIAMGEIEAIYLVFGPFHILLTRILILIAPQLQLKLHTPSTYNF